MKEIDFPGIQQAANKASQKAQLYYILLVRSNLIIGVIAALLTIFNFEREEPKVIIYIVSLVLLIMSLGITAIIKYLKYEDLWYQGRALAESIKTLTWRYVTCSENFESFLSDDVVETTFTDSIKLLQTKFPDLSAFMNTDLLKKDVITAEMNNIRNLSWDERRKQYLYFRIDNQISWYSTKAKYNKKRKTLWLWLVISAQAFAICSCTSLILCPSSSWNLVGLFTTLAASAIAWLELKQYQALIQAYTTATMELTIIKSLNTSLANEEDFIKYVLDSENAISREHTMWLAQKRK